MSDVAERFLADSVGQPLRFVDGQAFYEAVRPHEKDLVISSRTSFFALSKGARQEGAGGHFVASATELLGDLADIVEYSSP